MSETTPYRELPKLTVEVAEPSYRAVLEWMQTGDLPNISYDCWPRGNYTRRGPRVGLAVGVSCFVPLPLTAGPASGIVTTCTNR